MKKRNYFLTASILACVLFAASPASIFADGTGKDPATSGAVSAEQAGADQTEDSREDSRENPGYIRGTEGQTTDLPDSSWQKAGDKEENSDAYAVKTVEDGTYVIAMASDGFKVLDSSAADGAVKLGEADGSVTQRFRVAWDEGGKYYTIQTTDGSYFAAEDGYQMTYSSVVKSSGPEAWYIVPDGSGHYTMIAKQSGMAAEIAAAGLSAGARLCLNGKSGSALQKVDFLAAKDSEAPGEGYYEFASASDLSQVLDVENGSVLPGANVRMTGANGTDAQKFAVRAKGDGTSSIMAVTSGLFVAADGTASGANVRQIVKSGDAVSRWIVKAAGDGTYYIRSAADRDKVLTVSNGNVQIRGSAGAASQKFVMKKTDYRPPTGIYYIASAVNTGYVIDVYDGSRKMQANVQLFANNGSNAQKFEIIDKGYGYVAIRNVKSKHFLDVAGGSRKNGANIWQYRDNGGDAQLFAAHRNMDGTYTFVNAGSGKVIDVAGGKAANGTNIQQYDSNGTAAQKFVLQATSGSDGTPVDYSVYQPPKPSGPPSSGGSGSPLIRDAIDRKAQGYSSATNYEILVNRSNHTVSIYRGSKGNWTRIQRYACGDGKPSTPTIEGKFSVGIREKSFGDGYTCWYATQISGNYLFHSVLYYQGSMTRIKDGRLGMAVSHGCVRLAIENAKWIYDNIPRWTRIVIYH